MFFAYLTLFTALGIEAIGSFVSVAGLSKLFAGDVIVILMAIILDIGKVVSVTYAYRFWDKLTVLSKVYLPISILTYMLITSAGVFGYLSSKFETAIKEANTNTVLVTSMSEEQTRLQSRKLEIDAQIASVKSNDVYGRNLLIRRFGDESKRINDRLAVIDQELPALKVKAVTAGSSEIGPIMYVAEAFKLTPEQAVKYVIMMIMFVFDPMAVVLLIAANSLFLSLRSEKSSIMIEPQHVEKPVTEQIAVEEKVISEEGAPVAEEQPKDIEVEQTALEWPEISIKSTKQRKPRKPRSPRIKQIDDAPLPPVNQPNVDFADVTNDIAAAHAAAHAATLPELIEDPVFIDVSPKPVEVPLSTVEPIKEETVEVTPPPKKQRKPRAKKEKPPIAKSDIISKELPVASLSTVPDSPSSFLDMKVTQDGHVELPKHVSQATLQVIEQYKSL